MSRLPVIDVRTARWDRMREGVSVSAGHAELVVSLSALESHAGHSLTADEAVETLVDDKAMFAAVANTLVAQDGVITITSGILNSRSWNALPNTDGPEDSGPVYLEHGELR